MPSIVVVPFQYRPLRTRRTSPAAHRRENADSTALRDPPTSRTATNEPSGNAATRSATCSEVESFMPGKCNEILADLRDGQAPDPDAYASCEPGHPLAGIVLWRPTVRSVRRETALRCGVRVAAARTCSRTSGGNRSVSSSASSGPVTATRP